MSVTVTPRIGGDTYEVRCNGGLLGYVTRDGSGWLVRTEDGRRVTSRKPRTRREAVAILTGEA